MFSCTNFLEVKLPLSLASLASGDAAQRLFRRQETTGQCLLEVVGSWVHAAELLLLCCVYVFIFVRFLFVLHSGSDHDKSRTQKRAKSYSTAASIDTRADGMKLQLVSCFLFSLLQLWCQTDVSGPGSRAHGPDRYPDPEEEDWQVDTASSVTSPLPLSSSWRAYDHFLFSGSGASNHQQAQSSVASMSAVWKSGHQRPPETFEFQPPVKVRNQPEGSVVWLTLTDWLTNLCLLLHSLFFHSQSERFLQRRSSSEFTPLLLYVCLHACLSH